MNIGWGTELRRGEMRGGITYCVHSRYVEKRAGVDRKEGESRLGQRELDIRLWGMEE